MTPVTVVPANEVSWDDLAAVFGGLVAFLDGQPVGWCAVGSRASYPRLLRNVRVPWDGRAEDKADDSVWAVTCFVTRTGFRKRGISYLLARAAVDFARQGGARALEGYPMVTTEAILSELHVGTRGGSPRSAGRPRAAS